MNVKKRHLQAIDDNKCDVKVTIQVGKKRYVVHKRMDQGKALEAMVRVVDNISRER